MEKRRVISVAGAAGAALAGAVVLLAVLRVINSGRGFESCVAAVPLGWTLPLLGSVVIGLTAWLLLGEEPAPEPEAEEEQDVVHCPFCDSVVRSEWRLCPFCGRRLEAVPSDAVTVGDTHEA